MATGSPLKELYVTAKMLIGLLHKERYYDKCSDLMDLATMHHFSSFLKAFESTFFPFFLLDYVLNLFHLL